MYIGKEEAKVSLFANNIIVYLINIIESTEKLWKWNLFNKVANCKMQLI